jgi:hypothetical protein
VTVSPAKRVLASVSVTVDPETETDCTVGVSGVTEPKRVRRTVKASFAAVVAESVSL